MSTGKPAGIPLFKDDGGRQTPALGLFHELGHAYERWNHREEQKRRGKEKDEQYDNDEERFVIEKYETPAAKILRESVRKNHDGAVFQSVSPISTEEIKN
jgi:hypothetical protein